LLLLVHGFTVNSLPLGIEFYQWFADTVPALSTNLTKSPYSNQGSKATGSVNGLMPAIGYTHDNESRVVMTGIGSPPLLSRTESLDSNNHRAQDWGTVLDTIEYFVAIALIQLVLYTACKHNVAGDLEMMVMCSD
jgi:hypothetical protein